MRMKPIITKINGEQKLVVYIEYHDSKPHSVITIDLDGKGRDNWDFDLNMDWGEFMHYNSGSGGGIKNMHGPQYADGTKRTAIWYVDIVTFDKKHPPKNCRILKSPIRLTKLDGTTTIDPFKFSYQEVDDIIYCKHCDGYFHGDGCSEHMDMWEYKYHDGSEIE